MTAAFNKNLLVRINRELGGDFELDRFEHRVVVNEELGRVEMYLVSTVAQTVGVCGESFSFEAGESIHSENSHKFTVDGFAELAAEAGLSVRRVWTDASCLFSVQYLTPR